MNTKTGSNKPLHRRIALLTSSAIVGALSLLCVSAMLSGCAKTVQNQPSVIGKALGEKPVVPAATGFLGSDYARLQPGQEGQALLVYIDQTAQWRSYNKILLEPVQFWDGENSSVPPADQQMLADYFHNVIKKDLEAKNFTLVDQAAPRVIRLQVAIINAAAATPGLRTVSVLVPQIRVINAVQSLGTGSYAFVGGAEVALKATDSQTGTLLAAAIDQRKGGSSLTNVTVFKWGDAENVMDFWAEKITARFGELRSTGGTANTSH
ncbi:MAG: DUF3313 domain-containing protein [Candidatus Binataceae bacterium]